jgi:hypothetical protein
MANNTAFTQTALKQKQASPAFASGKVTMPATSITAADFLVQTVGFTPRYIRWYNTTGIFIEWFDGMAADSCLKRVAAGDATLETTNQGITICDSDGTANAAGNSFKVSQNATLIAITADDIIYWIAQG